uniref:Uncharacterized protein n=1 Tax=Oryza sativa subsp. japonica TaxID=39947 RepID=Q69X79_ORYSJ|nr:hypothetical protein [Oryza sativa Japonica Group]BAD32922.1 hypothetical protein [Oryza sativa Japonica Group]
MSASLPMANIRAIPTGAETDYGLDPAKLLEVMQADADAGLVPTYVCAMVDSSTSRTTTRPTGRAPGRRGQPRGRTRGSRRRWAYSGCVGGSCVGAGGGRSEALGMGEGRES